MKIKLIDHLFHSRTGSAIFIENILAELGDVEVEYDDSYSPLPQHTADLSNIHEYDLVWVHQNVYPALLCAKMGVKNLVFTPMYDGGWGEIDVSPLKNHKVICFSSTQYYDLQRQGFTNLLYVKYYPVPYETETIKDFSIVKPYFWQRRQLPNWKTVTTLLKNNTYDKLRLHFVSDGNPLIPPTTVEQYDHKISMTKWFKKQEDAKILVNESNLYFAPRQAEGIGMAFLDAMAAGIPVVAPADATHTEYICHGVTGYLYDINDPEPLPVLTPDLLSSLSENVKLTMEAGYSQWLNDRARIKEFAANCGNFSEVVTGGSPLITIATVVKNDEKGLLETLLSIREQTEKRFKHIVIDGNSENKASLEMLTRAWGTDSKFISEPDSGIYDAMNKAAQHCDTEYILYINAGDRLMRSDTMRELNRALKRTVYPDFLCASFCFVDKDGFENIKWLNYSPEMAVKEVINSKLSARFFDGVPNHNSMVIRADLVRKHPYDLTYTVSADTDHYFRCLYEGASIAVAPVLCNRFISGGNSTKKRVQLLNDMKRTFSDITHNKKKISQIIGKVVGKEIETQLQYCNLSTKDIWWLLTNYPIEATKKAIEILLTPKAIPFESLYKEDLVVFHIGQTIDLEKTLEKLPNGATVLCSQDVQYSMERRFTAHTFLTIIRRSQTEGRSLLVVSPTGSLPKEQKEFFKQNKFKCAYVTDGNELRKAIV